MGLCCDASWIQGSSDQRIMFFLVESREPSRKLMALYVSYADQGALFLVDLLLPTFKNMWRMLLRWRPFFIFATVYTFKESQTTASLSSKAYDGRYLSSYF